MGKRLCDIEVKKREVLQEVQRVTEYIGAKAGDGTAYDKVRAVDDDRGALERFWLEACDGATDTLKPFLVDASLNVLTGWDYNDEGNNPGYSTRIEVSQRFQRRLSSSVNTSLYRYFVAAIVSNWCAWTSKPDAERYAIEARAALADVERKLYYRERPQRSLGGAPETTIEI